MRTLLDPQAIARQTEASNPVECADSGVGRLAFGIRSGDVEGIFKSLASLPAGSESGLRWIEDATPTLTADAVRAGAGLNQLIARHFRRALDHPLDLGEPAPWYAIRR